MISNTLLPTVALGGTTVNSSQMVSSPCARKMALGMLGLSDVVGSSSTLMSPAKKLLAAP